MVTLYRNGGMRAVMRTAPDRVSLLYGLFIWPFIPWSFRCRPTWIKRNIGDWWKEDVCRSK